MKTVIGTLLGLAVLLALGEAARPFRRLQAMDRTKNFLMSKMSKRNLTEDYCLVNKNPCGDNGYCCSDPYCVTPEKPYTCYCDWPYGGENCEQVCSLSKCEKDFYDSLYPPMDYDYSYESYESYENYDSSGRNSGDHFPMPPGEVAQEGGRFGHGKGSGSYESKEDGCGRRNRRTQGIKQRRAAMLRNMNKRKRQDFEAQCRDTVQEYTDCLKNEFEKQSYCACENYTVEWAQYQLKNPNEFEYHCSTDYGCSDGTVQECVYNVQKALGAIWGWYDSVDAARESFDVAESCLANIASEGLPLDGCGYDSWVFEENIPAHRAMFEASIAGCDIDDIGMACPYPDVWGNPCSDDLGTQVKDHMQCMEKALNNNTACAPLLEFKDIYKNDIVNEASKQCKVITDIRDAMAVCVVPRQPELTKKQSKKDSKKINLLKKLLKEALRDLE